ncbi:T9SS type A sorting domain-containing protein [candidate division WOR-3 bacterium]|nr:T9SS type A sorting domain-containing protein [candidate division WOR-3 bacterium]
MKKIFTTSLFAILAFYSLTAGQLVFDFSIDRSDFNLISIGERSLIQMEDGMASSEKGSPFLPSLKINYSIPSRSVVRDVVVEDAEWIYLGNYRIFPSQGYVRLDENFVFHPEDPEIYSENAYYPENILENFTTGNKSGFSICALELNPFRYNPATGELYYLERCRLKVDFDDGLGDIVYLTEKQSTEFSRQIEGIVENPGDVFVFSPMIKDLRDSSHEYVIVAPYSISQEFEELIEWKSRKGYSSVVVPVESIYVNYSGYDDMEKIRNFVKDMHQNHGLIYLVLAGDHDNLGSRVIPIRNGSTTDNTPSDLYFSDVVPYSSNWDGNGNHVYGEYNIDGCDWYSDVYVGRFPVNNSQEVQRWISKVIGYEQNPPSGYLEKSLMAGAGLWPSVNYYGDRVCNYIADNFLPVHWQHVKMYQTDTLSFPQGFTDSFSDGCAWSQICGHGNPDGIYWYNPGGSIIDGSSASALTNGMKLGVVHSIACQPGWFDNYECVGEKLFNAPNGGAIAVQFNARYGWGAPPSFGPSEWLCIWLAEVVFTNEVWNIGAAHGLSKDVMVPGLSQGEHWCVTELNLFADPETPVYSSEPQSLYPTYDPVVSLGSNQYSVNVSNSRDPVEGAVCCLSDRDEPSIKFYAVTDPSGNAVVSTNFISTTSVVLTVTSHDYRAFLDTIPASSSSSFVAFTGIDTVIGGYQNGQFNTGCHYSAKIDVANFGTQTANAVRGVLSCSETGIAFNQDTLVFGNIDPSDTVTSAGSAAFSVSNNIPDGTTFHVDLTCFDQDDSTWLSSFDLTVNSPQIDFVVLKGPQTASPGDTLLLTPVVKNTGSANAFNSTVKMRTTNTNISVFDSSETVACLHPDSSAELYRQFAIAISPSCPEPTYIDLVFEIKTESLDVFCDTFVLYVGQAFEEDFEGTPGDWIFSGPSSWHTTEHTSNSPTHSMYCGVENNWTYSNSIANSRVISPAVDIARGSQLTFWHKYELYDNKDKVQVMISTDGGSTWDLINPVQGYTGKWAYAPYDSIYTGSQQTWQRQDFILDYEGEVKLSWLFFSNPSQNAEGYYFDDVSLHLSSGLTGVEEPVEPSPLKDFELFRAYPNPTQGEILISYSLGVSSIVEVSVFDITGRQVIRLYSGEQNPGRYSVEWNGRDEKGELMPSGTYFYKVTACGQITGDKFIVVK